jgi:tetratricopeptide (TPR) repeat protein
MIRWGRIFIILLWLAYLVSGAWAAEDLLAQGLAAQKAGKHEQAAELLGKYLKNHPDAVEARRALVQALTAKARKAEALAVVEQGLSLNPKNIPLMLSQGGLLAGLDRRGEAIAVFTKVIALDPQNAEAFKERGDNQAQEGRFDEALADLNRAARLNPKDVWVFNKRGMVWLCQGNYEKALADFSTAIQVGPDLPHAYFFRGNVYRHHLNQPDKAIADYQQACKMGHPLACRELEKMGAK